MRCVNLWFLNFKWGCFMNFVALLKRVLPFVAGLFIGLIPSWIFMSPQNVEVEYDRPTFVRSRTYCNKRSEFRKEIESRPVEDSPLRITSKPRPDYTESARTENVEGSVILRVTFLASGKIGAVTPTKTLPNGLTEQAIEAAKEIQFEPAKADGRFISVSKQVEYSFLISDF